MAAGPRRSRGIDSMGFWVVVRGPWPIRAPGRPEGTGAPRPRAAYAPFLPEPARHQLGAAGLRTSRDRSQPFGAESTSEAFLPPLPLTCRGWAWGPGPRGLPKPVPPSRTALLP